MTLFDPDRRYRRQQAARRWKLITQVSFIAGVAALAFWLGQERTRIQIESLEREVMGFEAALARLEEQNKELRSETLTATALLDQERQKYGRDVPTGTERTLLEAIRSRLSEGFDAERLAFVIGEAGSEARDCTVPETKRFLVRTPISRGAAASVNFADGLVTVTGEGESDRNEAGQPEAWYDPAADLSLRFRTIDGEESVARGVLPIQHAFVAEGFEHRFTAAAGARGFVEVTGDRCPFP